MAFIKAEQVFFEICHRHLFEHLISWHFLVSYIYNSIYLFDTFIYIDNFKAAAHLGRSPAKCKMSNLPFNLFLIQWYNNKSNQIKSPHKWPQINFIERHASLATQQSKLNIVLLQLNSNAWMQPCAIQALQRQCRDEVFNGSYLILNVCEICNCLIYHQSQNCYPPPICCCCCCCYVAVAVLVTALPLVLLSRNFLYPFSCCIHIMSLIAKRYTHIHIDI